MPGFLLNAGSTILCTHAGIVRPVIVNPRVLINGQPVMLQTEPCIVAGCSFHIAGVPSPCVTANWITAASRIMANGAAVLLKDSQAICLPNGMPVIVITTQTRVSGI